MRTKELQINQGTVSISQGPDHKVRTTRQVANAQSQGSRPPGRAGDQGSTLEVPEPGQEEGGGWAIADPIEGGSDCESRRHLGMPQGATQGVDKGRGMA